MADTVNIQALDAWTLKAWYSAYLPHGASAVLVDELVELLEPASDAALLRADQVTLRFVNETPAPAVGATAHIYDACALTFAVGLEDPYTFYFVGPKAACFLPDGSVDLTYAPLDALIDWLLANASAPTGGALTAFTSGKREQVQPGWVAVGAAAAYVKRGGLVADFYTQDGVDVRVNDE